MLLMQVASGDTNHENGVKPAQVVTDPLLLPRHILRALNSPITNTQQILFLVKVEVDGRMHKNEYPAAVKKETGIISGLDTIIKQFIGCPVLGWGFDEEDSSAVVLKLQGPSSSKVSCFSLLL